MNPSDCQPSAATKRPLRWGVIASVVFHAVVLVLLLIYRPWQSDDSAEDKAPATSGAGAIAAKRPAPPETERLVRSVDQVQPRLNEVIEETRQRTDQQNVDELTRQIQRLDSISSEESVEQLAARFQQWLGAKPRAQRPAEEPVDGEFDVSTAQLYEVQRHGNPDGSWTYTGVLLDAEGRTVETNLDAQQGQRAYEVMQTLEESPLAQQVYRQIAIPLLDKLLDKLLDDGRGPVPQKPEAAEGQGSRD